MCPFICVDGTVIDVALGCCCVTQCFPDNLLRWSLVRVISAQVANQKASYVRLLGAWLMLRDARKEHRVARL